MKNERFIKSLKSLWTITASNPNTYSPGRHLQMCHMNQAVEAEEKPAGDTGTCGGRQVYAECYVTGKTLTPERIVCHHINPYLKKGRTHIKTL